jgi:hypothetical protein
LIDRKKAGQIVEERVVASTDKGVDLMSAG